MRAGTTGVEGDRGAAIRLLAGLASAGDAGVIAGRAAEAAALAPGAAGAAVCRGRGFVARAGARPPDGPGAAFGPARECADGCACRAGGLVRIPLTVGVGCEGALVIRLAEGATEEADGGLWALTARMAALELGRTDGCAEAADEARRLAALEEAAGDLRLAVERYRSLDEDMPACLVCFRADTTITYVNGAMAAMAGREPSALMGARFVDICSPEERDGISDHLATLSPAHCTSTHEQLTAGPGNEPIWLQWTVRAFFDGAGQPTHYHAIGIDVGELKRAEQARAEMQRGLTDASRLEALGVLAGGVANDFNNILTSILGHAEVARSGIDPDSVSAFAVEHILEGSRRASDLCSQLMAYAGEAPTAPEVVAFGDLVRETALLAAGSISKKVHLDVQIGEGVSEALADRGHLRQITLNLIVNAAEALEDRPGVVRVRVQDVEVSEADLRRMTHHADAEPGRYVRLEVIDTGIGMDAATFARAFEPFYSTKFRGRGLGLSAVLGIVRAHRGALNVSTSPGSGTTFEVFLPTAGDAVARDVASDEPGAERVALVVDDEIGVREVCERLLEHMGIRSVAAVNGRHAVDLLRQNAARVAVVLLDIMMPEMDGEQALTEMRRIDPGVPVVVMSGLSKDMLEDRLAGRGVSCVLQKPFTFAELREGLDEALDPVARHPRTR